MRSLAILPLFLAAGPALAHSGPAHLHGSDTLGLGLLAIATALAVAYFVERK